ncbi:hypothetical protein ABH944_004829 [Caballeronia udeis]|uniref:Transposase n=1 Tax=Caballeronia udeis TaxID=1232866 RepID=A0ABW8MLW1_9BURK
MFYSDYLYAIKRMAHIQIEPFSHAYVETINGKYSRTVDMLAQVVWC